MRECCRQSQAEVVSKSRNTTHQTWGPRFSRTLYVQAIPLHAHRVYLHACARARHVPPAVHSDSVFPKEITPPRAITRLHVHIDRRNAEVLCSKNKASCNKMNWSCCRAHVPFRILLSARQESHDSHSIMPDLGKIYVSGHHGNSFSSIRCSAERERERRLVGSGSMCCVGTKIIPPHCRCKAKARNPPKSSIHSAAQEVSQLSEERRQRALKFGFVRSPLR